MTLSASAGDSGLAPLIKAASQWLIGISLAVMLTLTLLALSAVQLSEDGAGQRLLRRSVAVSTNLDAILPDLQAALRERARDSDEETVRLPDFPIPVELPRDEALSLEGPELRERILREAGALIYDDGMSAWAAADPEAERSIESISIAGAINRGLGLISERNHDRLVIATVVLGVFSALLAALLVVSVRSWGKLIALSAVTLGSALPPLATAVGVRFAFRTAQEEADPFVSGLLDLGVEAMWVPIRNYLTLTVLAFSVMLLTLVVIWASSRLPPSSIDHPAG